MAGVELTLLDCARYFHRAAGINGLAQIAQDRREGESRGARLDRGALRELVGATARLSAGTHRALQQAEALRPFAEKPRQGTLDPSVKPLMKGCPT